MVHGYKLTGGSVVGYSG